MFLLLTLLIYLGHCPPFQLGIALTFWLLPVMLVWIRIPKTNFLDESDIQLSSFANAYYIHEFLVLKQLFELNLYCNYFVSYLWNLTNKNSPTLNYFYQIQTFCTNGRSRSKAFNHVYTADATCSKLPWCLVNYNYKLYSRRQLS